MSVDNLVWAWKDPDRRDPSFDESSHPAGAIDLGLGGLVGGVAQPEQTRLFLTLGCCHGFTVDTCINISCPYTCDVACQGITLGCA